MDKIAFDLGLAYKSPIGVTSTLGDVISNFVQAAMVIAGFIFFLLIIGGGISMIAGAGQSDPQKTAKGKKALTYALIGFIIVFTSYWAIAIIEEMFGSDFITNPGI